MRRRIGVGGFSTAEPTYSCAVRDRSEWVWESRWRQLYFVLGTAAVAALFGFLIEGRLVLGLIVFAAVGTVAALLLGHRRRQR
jgi:hypothetical protein